jgi:kynurenine formamidase
VLSGLAFLQARVFADPRDPYVLVGHSAGATLAFQTVMAAARRRPPVAQPRAVVGLEGVYDLRGLNARRGGAYSELFGVPFGPDESKWDAASPARHDGFAETWDVPGKVGAVGHAPADELVDMAELEVMVGTLRAAGLRTVEVRDLEGGHDEVVEDGREVVRVLGRVLAALDEVDGVGKQ